MAGSALVEAVVALAGNVELTAVLDQIVSNLVVPNNVALSLPVHCRIM